MPGAGDLSKELVIWNPSAGTEADGTPKETYVQGSTVYARVVPTAGLERFSEANVNGEVTHKIDAYYTSEITRVSQLRLGARVFHVTDIVNPRELGEWMVIMAREEV